MENVKRDTVDLYPIFWDEFENNKCNREIRNNLVTQLLMKTQIDTSKFYTKLTLANFCDVLIFLLRKADSIFNKGLNSYFDILSVMCIYSSLIRELNIFDKNNSLNLVEEFIEIFNNFNNVIETLYEKNEDLSITNDILISINKTKDLYLRISQCI